MLRLGSSTSTGGERMSKAEQGVSSFERIEAILRNEAVYELAKLIPEHQDGDVGRKMEFPTYMLFVFDALISVFTSARKAEAEISDRHVWHFMRRTVKKQFPNDRSMWLPAQRYKRHHYMYGRTRYLTDPAMLASIQELHRKLAAEQARELGLLDPEGEGSFTHPSLDRLIYADGKVIAPLYKAKPGDTRVNKETGEIRPLRYEADADLHFQGDGEMAYGVKFLLAAVRSQEVHGRIILDAEHVPVKGGEAKTAMESFRAVAPHAPGAQGVIYDTALRGMHHAELMRDLGWLSINRVQAAEVVKREGKPVKRVEKTVHVEDKKVKGKTVRLFAKGGALGVVELTDTGDQTFVELQRLRTMRQADKSGRYRFYNEYALPDGGSVTVRLDTTDEDRERKLNRSENVRQISPTDREFKRIYRRRSDIESINRAVDDSLWIGRAHSRGADRQLMNLIGFAIMTNSLAIHRHRRRLVDGGEAAA
jgi:hypothetical protein